MARAVFEVLADTSSVMSALSSLPPFARRVATAMRAEFRQAFKSTAKGAQEMRDQVAKAYLEAGLAARKYVEDAAAAEKKRTAITKSEGGYRTNARRSEAEEAARQEQRITNAAEREARKRKAIAERAAREASRFASQWTGRAFGAATQAGGAIHGAVQGARQQWAGTERSIGAAVYQAGGDRAERDARVAQVRALSMETGLSADDIAQAMLRSQSEFNALAGDNPAARAQAFQRFSRTMRFAGRTNTNAGEAARLQGMLEQSGFGSDMQDTLMRFAAGAASSGSVEMGDLTRQALGSIMRRMGTATSTLGRGATPAEREAAMAAAFRQQVAALQVFRAGGETPRNAGNAMAAATNVLQDPTRQDKLLTNIRTARDRSADPTARARFDALIASVFERDPTRRGNAQRVRANYRDPLALQAALFTATNGNAVESANILAGGGHGNPQSFLANQRNLFAALGRTDANGVTGAQRVHNLMGATLTREDEARGAAIFGNDAQAQLNREETSRVQALTDNTNALVRLSNALAGWSASNPMAAAVMGGVGMSAAGGILTRGAGMLAGGGAGTIAAAGGGAAGAATAAGAGLLGGLLGAGLGEGLMRVIDRVAEPNATAERRAYLDRNAREQSIFGGGLSLLAKELRDAFNGGAPIVARVSPTDAAHAARQAQQGAPANTSR